VRPPLRHAQDLLVSGFFGCALISGRSAVRIRCRIVGRGRTGRICRLLCDVGLRSGGAFRTLRTASSRCAIRAAGSGSAGRALGSRLLVDGLFTTDDGSTHQERDSPNGGISGNDSKILLHDYRLSGSVDREALRFEPFGYLDNQSERPTRNAFGLCAHQFIRAAPLSACSRKLSFSSGTVGHPIWAITRSISSRRMLIAFCTPGMPPATAP
jgi:hypothetical protein